MSTVPVYVKTPKGIAEMNERGQDLSPRERRVLIMADGKRDADEITAMFPNDEVNLLFANLLEKGYLTPLHAQSTPKDVASTAVAPPADAEQRFVMAKNLMTNTVRMMLGSMGSGLLNRIEKCSNLDELRLIFQAWREAILMTKEGRKQGAELESRVAALLS